ncbi:MAG: serine/threonine protein kinase [Verrucomicrobiales bacterium]|nr:serine/threonine protein kinase [Verrucomicrobiales bacterium]
MMPHPNPPGYTLDSRIGRGAFGTVYRARWQGHYPFAVKVLEEGALHWPYLGSVLEKLRALPEHPGLLKVHAFDLDNDCPYVGTALLPENAMTFDELSGQVTEEEAWGLLRQLSDTLAWMHGHGIVHAGVTGGNVFVVSAGQELPRVVLADAGQAWLGDGSMERLHDQAPCMPPERWRDPGRVLRDGRAEGWDVYAFGVLAWRLLTGDWPRATQVFETVLASRGEGLSIDPPAFAEWLAREPAPHWRTRSLHEWEKPCRAMVMRCLETDSDKRPESMMEVALALRKCPPLRAALGTAVPVGGEPDREHAGGMERPERPAEPKAEVRPWENPAVLRNATPAASSAALTRFPPFAPVFAEPLAEPIKPPNPAFLPASPTMAHEAAPAVSGPAAPKAGATGPGQESGANKAPSAPKGWNMEMAAVVILVGVAVYVFSQKTAGDRSRVELNRAGMAARDAEHRAAASEAQADAYKKQVEEQRSGEMAALRDRSAVTVGKMLASAPAEPAERAVWQAAALPVAEQLREALAACDEVPALAASSLEARWQLAALYSAVGKSENALPLLERLSRDLDTLPPADAAQEDQRRLLKARMLARRASLLQEEGKTAEAVPLLLQASESFSPWVAAHPDRHDAARDFARHSLLEGRVMLGLHLPDDAAAALGRVTGLLPKPEGADFQPEDTFTLADALNGLAEIAESRSSFAQAVERRTQALQLLLAYDSRHPKSMPCRTRLTETLLSLGQTLSVAGAPKDAIHTFQQAVRLLSEMTTDVPSDATSSLQLARAYTEVAQLVHTADSTPEGAGRALDYGKGALAILRRLQEANSKDSTLQLRLASVLVLNGELEAASGGLSAALTSLQEGVTIASRLNGGAALPETQRNECRKLTARAWAVIGGAQEKAGNLTEAAASFTSVLEALRGLDAGDQTAKQMTAAAQDRLKKLQAGG